MVGKESAQIPSTLMFLTGGDTTVRGYGYRDIGTVRSDGQTVAGRYLGVLSLEWQRPFVYKDKLTDFESVVFVDAEYHCFADGQGSARFSGPSGLTLREYGALCTMSTDRPLVHGPAAASEVRLFRRFFTGVAGKERKKPGAAGAGRRPGRIGKGKGGGGRKTEGFR